MDGLLESEMHDHVIVMGDFNTDLRRSEGKFSVSLCSFLKDHNLLAVGLNDSAVVGQRCTWHNHNHCQESWIDYVCVSKSLNSVVEDFQILEGEALLSDHWPVVMSSNIGIDSSDNIAHEATYTKSLLWKKVREKDLSRYQLCLKMELEMINIPVEAAICNDTEH